MKTLICILLLTSLNIQAQELLNRDNWSKIYNRYKTLDQKNRIKRSYSHALKKRIGIEKRVQTNNLVFRKIKVAVIDTGLDLENPILTKYSPYRNPASVNDVHGHGSHVYGILSLLTSHVSTEIIPYKFYSVYNTGMQNLIALREQLRKAIDDKVDIINLSLDGPQPDKIEYELLQEAQEKGIIVIVASGNNSINLDMPNCDTSNYAKDCVNYSYPTSYTGLDNMITVANYKDKTTLSESSNYGKNKVTLGTIGEQVPSFGYTYGQDVPRFITGTSQATPIITSAIVKLKQRYPYITLKQIKYILKINSHKDKNTQYGFFDYSSFISWMNTDFTYYDINPHKKVDFDSVYFLKYYIHEALSI